MSSRQPHRLRNLAAVAALAAGVLVPLSATPALAAEGDIQGRVTLDGAPPDDFVCVQAFNSANGALVASTETSASTGNYVLTVPAGSYRVRAVDECRKNLFFDDPEFARTWYSSATVNGSVTYGGASAVTVDGSGSPPVGIDPVMVDIDMKLGAELGGEVVHEVDNAKLADICVRVFQKSATGDLVPVAQELTNAEGFWGFGGLPRTDVRIEFSDDREVCNDDGATPNPDPDGEYVTEWWRDEPTAGTADPVPLSDDLYLGAAKLARSSGSGSTTPSGGAPGTISGELEEDNERTAEGNTTNPRKPAAGICVAAFTLQGTEVASTISDEGGNYLLTVDPGQYRIRYTSCTTGFHVTNWWQDERSFDDANPVTVEAGADVTDIYEFMEDAGIVNGSVIDQETSTPLGDVTVEAWDADTQEVVASGVTAGNGTFRIIGVPPGIYRFRFVPSDTNYGTRWHGGSTNFASATDVEVEPDVEITGIDGSLGTNSPPIAEDDTVDTSVDTPVIIESLLLNDTDPDGDGLTIVSVGTPDPHGTAELNQDGTVTFTPGDGEQVTSAFTYTIADPSGATDSATVTVTVDGSSVDGDPPIARNDSATTIVDEPVVIVVVDNDTDPDGDPDALRVTAVSEPAHGTATISSNRTVRYSPEDGFEGVDTFSYEITDDQGLSDVGTVTVTVGQGASQQSATGTQVGPGGTVSSEGDEATAANPIITSVTTPNGGDITITESTQDETVSGTRTIAGVKAEISAPDASATDPLVITFRVDGSVLDGDHAHRSYVVLRNRSYVDECMDPTAAMPDPCVAARRVVGDDIVFTVRTSQGSTWEFGLDEDPRVLRLSGAGRVETATAISRWTYAPEDVDTVVLARADQYPDALAGAPLAAAVGGPLLLTQSGELDAATRDEIDRLDVDEVIILGGEAAISTTVENQVRARPSVLRVSRIAGTDRFDTAARVASRLGAFTEAYVVEGADADPLRGWPDALSVAPLAAFRGVPILLVDTDHVPSATAAALDGLDQVTIVGGTAAVSAAVEAEIDRTVDRVGRIAGSDRFDTSYQVALAGIAAGMDADATWFATGLDFPDALAAGPAVAREGGALLLIHGQDLDASPRGRSWLADRRGTMEIITLAGGTAAISTATQLDIIAATDR